jgi:hypothetical protein
MRFQVPQFIDVEDKLVGPLTLKQFIIYVLAAMLLVPVFLLSDLQLFLVIAVPVIGLAAALAHVRIANQSLFSLGLNAAKFALGGAYYVWDRAESKLLLPIQGDEIGQGLASGGSSGEGLSLSQRGQNLEAGGNVVETDEIEDVFAEE